MANEIDTETRQEVIRRLQEGDTASEIADETEGVSKSTAYRIRDELKERQEEREAMEEDVFAGGPEITIDDYEQVFNDIGVGVKEDGNLKAKVKKALSAIELDSAVERPYMARDTLITEGNMTREWANRVIRKVFKNPDFPQEGARKGGRERGPPPRYGPRDDEYESGREEYPPRGRGRDDGDRGRGRSRNDRPPWAYDLERQLEKQNEALQTVAEAIQSDQQANQGGRADELVEIHRQGDDGKSEVIRVPASSPRLYELLGDDQDTDPFEVLVKAKETGLIPSPEDFESDDDPMADALKEGLDSMASAQQQATQNFANAVGELRELAQSDDDEELTRDDINDILDERLTQAQQDQLHDEIKSLKEEVRENKNSGIALLGDQNTPVTDDKDVLTRYVDRQAESEQLNTVQHAGDKLMDDAIPEIRQTIRELAWLAQYGQVPGGENAPSRPSPPGYSPEEQPEPTVQSMQPEPTEPEPEPEPEPEQEPADDLQELWNAATGGAA